MEALAEVRGLQEDNMDLMRKAAGGAMQTIKMKDGKLQMDSFTASAIMKVYDKVNPANQKKMAKMINDGKKSGIMKLQDFAMKQVKSEYEPQEESRQLKDPKKEMMVSKKGKVQVIDKKDWPKYEKKGYVQAEETEIKEGTWAFPSNSREIKKAKDFMKKPQPLGKEGDDAASALYSIFGDDELHDELYKAGKENPKRDARDIVKQWLKDMVGRDYRDPKDAKNVKDVAKQLGIKEEVELDEIAPLVAMGARAIGAAAAKKATSGSEEEEESVAVTALKNAAKGVASGVNKIANNAATHLTPKKKKQSGPRGEETELDEAKYDLYHKDFSSAMQHAYKMAKKLHGITVDPKEIDDKVASGPRKPSEGKTNTYRLKGDKGAIQVQVYNKGGSKPYELNFYKEEVELDEDIALFFALWGGAAMVVLPALMALHAMPPKVQRKLNADSVKAVGNLLSKFKKDKNYKPNSAEIDASKKLEKEVKSKEPSIFKKAMSKLKSIKSKKEEVELDEMKSGNYALAVKGKFVAVGSKADMMKMKKQKGGEIYMSPGAKVGDKAEEVELDEALPSHLQKFFDKDGNPKSKEGKAAWERIAKSKGFKKYTDKQIKMAIGVAFDKRYVQGNMTGATKTIEKIAKGLSEIEPVRDALRRANEEVVKEGTWAVPKTSKQKSALKKLLSKPLDAKGATDKLYDIIGDDELFDQIDDFADTEPKADVRSMVRTAMKRLGIKEETILERIDRKLKERKNG